MCFCAYEQNQSGIHSFHDTIHDTDIKLFVQSTQLNLTRLVSPASDNTSYLALETLCDLLENVKVRLKAIGCLADEQQHMVLHVAAKDFRRRFLSEFSHQWQTVCHHKLLYRFSTDAIGHVRPAIVKL